MTSPSGTWSVCSLISSRQVAELGGITVRQLHRLRRRGRGPLGTKLGGRCWYRAEAVVAWLLAKRGC